MFKMKKMAIFDFDGTLVNSMDYWAELDRTLIERLTGVYYDENFQLLWEMKMKELACSENPILDYCRFLKNKYRIELAPSKILDERDKIAREFYRKDISAKKGAIRFVERMKESGMILTIATTTGRDNIVEATKNEALKELFDAFSAVYTYNDVLKTKPDPEVHFKIMEHFGVKSEECIIFEDSLAGVMAANNAGMDVVAIEDSQSLKNTDEIKRRSNRYIKDFDELM